MLKRLWCEDEGVLTFEWIMLLTLLVIGVIGGVAGIRDALIHEAADTALAITSLDQGYSMNDAPDGNGPLGVGVPAINGADAAGCTPTSGAVDSFYFDDTYVSVGRTTVTSLAEGTVQDSALCPVR